MSFSASASSVGSMRPAIDTTHFMSRYFHPKNIAAANGRNPYARAAIETPYSKTHGLYRQKQVDDEIERIRSRKKPSSSKITITINAANLLSVYHHHHHCLDVQLGSRYGKGRVVWFWEGWETATDERVMKGAIAALDSSWTGQIVESSRRDKSIHEITAKAQGSRSSEAAGIEDTKFNAIPVQMSVPNDGKNAVKKNSTVAAGDKRKRAAEAAESRLLGSYFQTANDNNKPKAMKQRKKEVEAIDLVDSD